ncbi:zinc finger protein 771-like [Siniperca chuatsi]|uniref:zinc finger protein 771-like n=1 Tax=Siniperca chuatsi TaxID=119488 RepID=UPI001CE215A3|nr:zinc finger protein 771-like [Siniperca chuatsi]
MSRVQKLRLFVSQRLNAAVEEILGVFEETIVKYEQEAALCQEVISRQHALLCALHKPLMELPSADAFTQQLLVSNKEVPPEHQDQDQEEPEPPHVEEEQEAEQLQDLDEADIIQFTYNPRCAARPGEDVDLSSARTARAEPGAAGPDEDVQLLSSETEDSDDYSKDSTDPKPKRIRRPGGPLSCRVCGRTFKARSFLFRHVKAHLQDAEPVCGLCGERFEAAENLKLHVQTHRTTQRRKRELENQTRTRSRERRFHQPDANAKVHAGEKPHACNDCGKTFLQAWKKKRHRCPPGRKSRESLGGSRPAQKKKP